MKIHEGVVADAESCARLAGVSVTRLAASGERRERVVCDRDGEWTLAGADPGDTVVFSKEAYSDKRFSAAKVPSVVRLLGDRLVGYQRRLSFVPGESVEIFVHSPVQFSATLYRHGLQKEAILALGTHSPCYQRVPDGYFVEFGLDWKPTVRYVIPSAAKPGIYSVLLEGDGGEECAVPFVVSTPASEYGKRARLLVVASTTTWQSYNLWGGRSRYRNFEDGHSPQHCNRRMRINQLLSKCIPQGLLRVGARLLGRHRKERWVFRRLSVLRPFTNCALEERDPMAPFCNHLGAGEWRVLAWLEREGIPYDIVSGVELHTERGMLRRYRAVVLSTHCEYWTREMYEELRHHHRREGLWVLNLSGNAIFREIEFSDDGSTRCVSLSFKDSCADETELLGVRFSEKDYGTCAPYAILAPEHWVFRGVEARRRTRCFGAVSLNRRTETTSDRYDAGRPGVAGGLKGSGASGWEMDKLSRSAPSDIKVIARGLNRGGGADMAVREPRGRRGGMFTASSICFGGCLLIDDVASTIVKNVLSRALEDRGDHRPPSETAGEVSRRIGQHVALGTRA